ncbi:MAG: type II secretion system F family protein, partial [Planctomycetes bacterium]|nr:type II secretion system F family protein [Planctomycetota bacterium]
MPIYKARAMRGDGRLVTVAQDAPNESELTREFERQGLTLARIVKISDAAKSTRTSWSVPRHALIDFTDRMQLLYAAGVPLAETLLEIEHGMIDPRMRAITGRLRSEVENGTSLSDAIGRFPNVFPKSYVSSVKAGESAGALDAVLERLLAQMEWDQQVKSQIRAAFTYPCVLAVAVTGLITFMITFVLPKLMAVFDGARVELPRPTQILLAVASLVQNHGGTMLLALVALLATFVLVRRTPAGGRVIDSALMRLPLVGVLRRKLASARFVSQFRTLHRAGAPVMTALELARDSCGDAAISQDLDAVMSHVSDGMPLSDALATSREIEPLVPRMVRVGERSGSLDEALAHVAALYDREVKASTKR